MRKWGSSGENFYFESPNQNQKAIQKIENHKETDSTNWLNDDFFSSQFRENLRLN